VSSLKLYGLRRYRKGPLVTDQFGDAVYFDNKILAKIQRNRISPRAVVTLGPDHKSFIKGE
jgi:hypothetical protein